METWGNKLLLVSRKMSTSFQDAAAMQTITLKHANNTNWLESILNFIVYTKI